MNGWAVNKVDTGASVVVGASATNTPVSKEFNITAGGATEGIAIKLVVSSVTVGTAITAKLQTAIGSDWEDSKTATITVAGRVYIKILEDATYMPLLNKGRVVITTGAGDSVSVDSVEVLQEL